MVCSDGFLAALIGQNRTLGAAAESAQKPTLRAATNASRNRNSLKMGTLIDMLRARKAGSAAETPGLPSELLAFYDSGRATAYKLRAWPWRCEFWPLEKLAEYNGSYQVSEHAPGYLGFAASGAGQMFAVAPEGEVVSLPFIAMKPDAATVLAPNWMHFESSLEALPEDRSVPFQSLGQYHDSWTSIVLSAPDQFHGFDDEPVDQAAELDKRFRWLRDGFFYVERKVKDEHLCRILRELIQMSHEAYLAGDRKTGAHVLQECEGMIWRGSAGRLKYVVEAERRAFGEVVRFKDVVVSPYPLEGTLESLASDQKVMLAHAQAHVGRYLEARDEFKFIAWEMDSVGTISGVSKRSLKATKDYLRGAAASGTIRACCIAQFVLMGIIVYDIEQTGTPSASVRAVVSDWTPGEFHYHLDEPSIFPGGPSALSGSAV